MGTYYRPADLPIRPDATEKIEQELATRGHLEQVVQVERDGEDVVLVTTDGSMSYSTATEIDDLLNWVAQQGYLLHPVILQGFACEEGNGYNILVNGEGVVHTVSGASLINVDPSTPAGETTATVRVYADGRGNAVVLGSDTPPVR